MNDVLLKTLTSSDIEWIKSIGQRQDLLAGEILTSENLERSLFIVLEGMLAEFLPHHDDDILGQAFAAIEGADASLREVGRFLSGDMVGKIPRVDAGSQSNIVKAIAPTSLISMPQEVLAARLKEDVGFAARFYRAIAILFADRVEGVISRIGQNKLLQSKAIPSILYVLDELNDSDLDWMMVKGYKDKIPAGKVLICQDEPVDALYILLDGEMAVSLIEKNRNSLTRIFAALDNGHDTGQEIGRLSRGELMGEAFLLDGRLPTMTITALKSSIVLTISQEDLMTKLQQDIGFTIRLYRVISALKIKQLKDLLIGFGYGRRMYSQNQSLTNHFRYEDELNLNELDQVTWGGKQFSWMLGQFAN